MGWGEQHRAQLAPITGTTGEVEAARAALSAVGVNGATLAEQAVRAAQLIEDCRAAR